MNELIIPRVDSDANEVKAPFLPEKEADDEAIRRWQENEKIEEYEEE